MVFTTPRLLIRALREEDLPHFHRLQSNAEVMRYVGGNTTSLAENTKDLKHIIQCYTKQANDFWIWAILLKEEKTFIGTCALVKNEKGEHEIGFRFLQEFWGKGYAKELVKELIRYAFDHLQRSEIVAYVDENNKASVKTLARYFTFISTIYNQEEQCMDRFYMLRNPNTNSFSE